MTATFTLFSSTNSVFEATVKIPYDTSKKQILGSGQKGGLNVGAVVILPDGFKLAPANQVSKEIKDKFDVEQEILEEVARDKKASGGIAMMLGE